MVDKIQQLEEQYIFRKPERVSEFLEIHPFLKPILQEARAKIADYFPDSSVFLEIFVEPEEIASSRLVAYIKSGFSAEETLEKLHQLDNDWWLDAVDKTDEKLSINVEF